MSLAPATSEMLAEMSACAGRLGLAFGKAAEAAEDFDRRLELFQLFDRCFFAVRVATALQLRLQREGRLAGRDIWREAGRDAEDLSDAAETERDEPDRPERERLDEDREREREPASFPVLLDTLSGVAAGAANLPGSAPGELPTLKDLIARATAAPPAGPASQPKPSPLRDRLAGSAALGLATLPPRPAPHLPAHRPTGPPRR